MIRDADALDIVDRLHFTCGLPYPGSDALWLDGAHVYGAVSTWEGSWSSDSHVGDLQPGDRLLTLCQILLGIIKDGNQIERTAVEIALAYNIPLPAAF